MSVVILIAGTDTGVGKTKVGCALARAWRDMGRSVLALKPVETGVHGQAGDDEDGVKLARAAQHEPSWPQAALLRLRPALAPPEAARQMGVPFSYKYLLQRSSFAIRQAEADVVLIEGAGGLLSPLTWTDSILDLAMEAGATRSIVVGADRLGTLNHTRLTLFALQGLPIEAVVLSDVLARDESVGTNAASLERVPGVPPVFTLPRLEEDALAAGHLLPLAKRLLE